MSCPETWSSMHDMNIILKYILEQAMWYPLAWGGNLAIAFLAEHTMLYRRTYIYDVYPGVFHKINVCSRRLMCISNIS